MARLYYFDINKKNMSRTIIFETAKLSGNRQSEHLYYHYSIKNLRLAQSVECLTAEQEVTGLISWGLTNTQGLNKNNWEMKELSLHCSRLDLHVAQMTT